jgi:hypothetical protein
LVEKSTGSRRRFTHEENSYSIGAVMLSQTLPLAGSVCVGLDATPQGLTFTRFRSHHFFILVRKLQKTS